jgi:hypothetical protein
MVLLRAVLTPQLAQLIAAEATKRGLGKAGVDSRSFMKNKFDPSITSDLQKCNQAFVDGLKDVRDPDLYGRLYGSVARVAFTHLVPAGTRATQNESRFMPGFYDAVSRFPMPRP